MGHHRRRKKRSAENNVAVPVEQSKGKINISDILKKTNFKDISGQLRGAADSLEKIGELVVLLEQVDIMVKPGEAVKGSSFNIMRLLKDGNSLNHLVQAILPVLGQSADEKRSEPITVEAVVTEKE